MIQIIDRYTLRLFLAYFLAGLLVFITLFLAVDFLSFAVRNSEAGFQVLVKYYLYYMPAIGYQMLPVGGLMATVFTLSHLNRSNELIALHSVGMSLARVSAPILIVVTIIAATSFFLSDRLLPRFAQKKNFIYYVEIKKKPGLYSTVNTDRIWYRSENILFNIKALDAENSRAQGLTFYYFDVSWNLLQMIYAKSMKMNGNVWDLQDGTVTLFAEESSFPLTQTFATKQIIMNEDFNDLSNTSNSSDLMSLRELRRFIKKNKEAGLETTRYEVDYHGKFGFAFSSFVMCLLGIPFSVGRQRSGGTAINTGICIGLAFLYWVFFSSAIALGMHGQVPALVAAWLPNVVLLAIAIYLLVRLRR